MSDYRLVRIQGRDYQNGIASVKVDASGRLPQIEFEHLAVHEDGIVIASDISTAGTTSAPLVYSVTCPAHKEFHCQFRASYNVPFTMSLYDTPTTNISGGTPITHGRYNRKSTASDTEVAPTVRSPTISDSTGTLLYQTHSGGTTSFANQASVGGDVRPGEEYVIDEGKTLTITILPDQPGGKCTFKNDFYDVNVL